MKNYISRSLMSNGSKITSGLWIIDNLFEELTSCQKQQT